MFAPTPQPYLAGKIKLDGLDLMFTPGGYKVSSAERFGDKISTGAIRYEDFNVYESAWEATSFAEGYGLQRYSDFASAARDPNDVQRREMYKASENVDCREHGIAVLGPKIQPSGTLLASTPIWIGEYTPSGSIAGTYIVVVTEAGRVYTVDSNLALVPRITLPAAPQRGAIGVFNARLVFGYGNARTAQYTADLVALTDVRDATPSDIYVWAFTADRAAAYVAGGPNSTDWNKVVSSADGGDSYSAPGNAITCGSSQSKITELAPGGGLVLVYVGKETELGCIDNTPNYRVLVPFDSRLSTNCFPGDTRVSWDSAPLGIARRWFDGEVIEITTANGRTLSGTPNHPVETSIGWVALGLLNEGDDVLVRGFGHDLLRGAAHEDDANPTLEEIYRTALDEGVAERRPGRSVDFHGDGQPGEIEIVSTERNLLNKIVASRRKSVSNLDLQISDFQQDALLRLSAPVHLVVSGFSSAKRFLSLIREPLPLLVGQPAHTERSSFVLSSRRNAPLTKHSDNNIGGHAVLSGHVEQRAARQILSDKGFSIGRKPAREPSLVRVRSNNHSSVLQDAHGRPASDPVTIGQLANRESVLVETDKVVKIRRIPFSGHVYNLQTTKEVYYAGGIKVHNCRLLKWWLGADGDESRGPLVLFFSRERALWSYQPSSETAGTARNMSPWSKPGIRPPEIRGIPTALQGTARWLYYTISNADGRYWMLCQDARSAAVHSLIALNENPCQAMTVSSVIGNGPRLYFGYGNRLGTIVLPLDGDSPLGNPGYPYITAGSLDLPGIDFDFPDEQKILFSVRVIADNLLPAARSITVSTSYDGGAYVELGTVSSSPGVLEFPTETSVYRVSIRLAFSTTDETQSPQLRAVVLRASINPKLYRIWEISIPTPSGSLANQTDDIQNPYASINSLWSAFDDGFPVDFIDRWADSWTVRIIDMTEQETYRESDRTLESTVLIRLLEVARVADDDTLYDAATAVYDLDTTLYA